MIEEGYDNLCLVFENCNYVDIKPENVFSLTIEGIKKGIYINVVQQYVEYFTSEYVKIVLKNVALNTKTNNEIKYGFKESFKDHLCKFKDITHIEIKHHNKKEYICVLWDGKSNFKNLWQKVSFLKKDKYIVIEICKPMRERKKHNDRKKR